MAKRKIIPQDSDLPLLIQLHKQSSDDTEKKLVAKKIAHVVGEMISAAMEGATDAGSFFTLANSIASGWQDSYQNTMDICARFGVPPIALVGAIRIILEQNFSHSRGLLFTRRLWQAAAEDMRLSAFILPLFFFTVTQVIRALQHSSDNSPVNISNSSAWIVIAAGLFIGSLGGVKRFFDEKRITEPTWFPEDDIKLQRFLRFLATNVVSRRVLAAVDGASAIHWLVFALQILFDVTTVQPWQIARYAVTGAAGLFSAILNGGESPEKTSYFKWVNQGLRIVKASAMGLTLYNAFTSRQAAEFWGASTLKWQFYFWLAAFPLFITLAQLMAKALKAHVWPPDIHLELVANPEPTALFPRYKSFYINKDGTDSNLGDWKESVREPSKPLLSPEQGDSPNTKKRRWGV